MEPGKKSGRLGRGVGFSADEFRAWREIREALEALPPEVAARVIARFYRELAVEVEDGTS
jgi:hypothetical protein